MSLFYHRIKFFYIFDKLIIILNYGFLNNILQVFVKIWKHEGPLTLYRGLTPTILGVIPYAGASFGIYETLKYYHKGKFFCICIKHPL